MGSAKNRQCPSGSLYCCNSKNLQRTASESDCTAVVKNAQVDREFMSYGEALKVLLMAKNSGGNHRDSRTRMIRQRQFFDNHDDDVERRASTVGGGVGVNEEFRYACQLAMGAPLVKRRKSDKDATS